MKEVSKSVEALVLEALTKIEAGSVTIKEGCKLLVQALDIDPDKTRAIMRKHRISETVFDVYEALGRGHLHHQLMGMPTRAIDRLKRLPIAEQERLIQTGVEVVQLVNDEPKVKVKSLFDMQVPEFEIAFDSTGNTPKEVQIERLRRKVLPRVFKLSPYKLEGDMLIARENCRIPCDELQRLARAALEAQQAKLKTLEPHLKKGQIVK